MVPHMQQASGHAQYKPGSLSGREAQQCHAHAHQYYPDIFHTVICQQPFQVMLADGEDHSEKPAGGPQNQKKASPEGRRRVQQKEHSQYAVDSHL